MSDFKVGDRVRIKSWDEMADQYTERNYGIELPLLCHFVKGMKCLCGLTATIDKIDNDIVKLKDWSDDDEHGIWTYSTDMLEKVTSLIVDCNTSRNTVAYEPYTIGVGHTIDGITCGKIYLLIVNFKQIFMISVLKVFGKMRRRIK